MHGGPFEHQVGHARYCPAYHFFESDCRFKESIYDPASPHRVRDACRIHICVQDPYGDIPQEAKQTIDSLIYALHRMVLYERIHEDELKSYKDQAMDAAIRSCEPLMDRLIEGDDAKKT